MLQRTMSKDTSKASAWTSMVNKALTLSLLTRCRQCVTCFVWLLTRFSSVCVALPFALYEVGSKSAGTPPPSKHTLNIPYETHDHIRISVWPLYARLIAAYRLLAKYYSKVMVAVFLLPASYYPAPLPYATKRYKT